MIDDRRGRQSGTLEGTCCFAQEKGSLLCSETGVLTLGGHSGPAHRAYRYFIDATSQVRIEHADGAPFVTLDFLNGVAEAHHICSDDTYNGVITILGDDHWTQHWTVIGPAKDHTLVSTLRRS